MKSILTAFGVTISTLVLALTGGGYGTPTPARPSDKGGLKEWVKKTLQYLVRALAKLAGKAVAAIPVIGSLVSWLLSLLSRRQQEGWQKNYWLWSWQSEEYSM